MEALRAQLESKKRALEQASKDVPNKKYLTKAEREELERKAEALLTKEKEEKQLEKLVKKSFYAGDKEKKKSLLRITDSSEKSTPAISRDGSTEAEPGYQVPALEVLRRLRKLGQPIRLFGETEKERKLRLRALELIEERTEGQRNEFQIAMEDMESSTIGLELERETKKNGKAKGSGEKQVDKKYDGSALVDVSLVKSDPYKVYPLIYHALKKTLREWGESLNERPEAVRRSQQGKIAATTQKTSADYLKPLFKSLKKRDLAPDVLLAIAEITYNMQIREYLKANDAYLRLSIGNAPWPIGVTMVGIHERSGREKIHSNNVAHVLNDETSRKYIQSLKRLLTFAQSKYPPDDISQKMG